MRCYPLDLLYFMNFFVMVSKSSPSLSTYSLSIIEALNFVSCFFSSTYWWLFMLILWIIHDPMSASRGILVTSFASWTIIIFASYLFGRNLRIFMTFSTLVYIFSKAWNSFVIFMNLANILPIDSKYLMMNIMQKDSDLDSLTWLVSL